MRRLTPLQHNLLLTVQQGEHTKQDDLARMFCTYQSSVSRALKILVRKNLLTQEGTMYHLTKKGAQVLEEWDRTPLQVAERRLQDIMILLPAWGEEPPEHCQVMALEILPVYAQVMRMLQRVGARITLIDGKPCIQMFDGKIPIGIIDAQGNPSVVYQEELPVRDDEVQNVYIKLVNVSHE